MTSDSTYRDDFRTMAEMLVPLAQEQLAEQGDFFPFGCAVNKEGECALSMSSTVEGEEPDNAELYELLKGGMRSRAVAGLIRASAMCIHSQIVEDEEDEEGPFAIVLYLEHQSGDAEIAFQTYTVKDDMLEFDEMAIGDGESYVFAKD